MNDLDVKILNAALKVFSENGYKNSTTRIIASEAGVNESTIFRKFKTKENLFESVIICNREKMGEEIKFCFINFPETDDSRDKLDYILNSVLTIMDDNYEILHTMINENTNIIVKKELSYFNQAISQGLEPLKPQNSEVNLQILSLTIISFLLFVLFEDVIVTVADKEAVFKEFSEYCARILQI